ncbi:MAG TPA: CDGSH iron-sulfur domain-containing protein [Nocardioidaceae bacterium]|nr:CDGSH iron-sulfur domain-containing protein [Nocardioidaceae bacterium]
MNTPLRLVRDAKRGPVEVTPCPGGPLLVRGAETVRDDEGNAHDVTRPVVAVCACGKSQRQPWCDGTHKVIPR